MKRMKQLDLFDIGVEHVGYRSHYSALGAEPHTFIVKYKNEEGRDIKEYFRRSQEKLAWYVWSSKPSRLVVVW